MFMNTMLSSVVSFFFLSAFAIAIKEDSQFPQHDSSCPSKAKTLEDEVLAIRGYVKSLHGNRTYLFQVEEFLKGFTILNKDNTIEFYVNNFYQKNCGILYPGENIVLYLDKHFHLTRAEKEIAIPGESFFHFHPVISA